jgi:hypothetical protein
MAGVVPNVFGSPPIDSPWSNILSGRYEPMRPNDRTIRNTGTIGLTGGLTPPNFEKKLLRWFAMYYPHSID